MKIGFFHCYSSIEEIERNLKRKRLAEMEKGFCAAKKIFVLRTFDKLNLFCYIEKLSLT